jgi:hypothetical protein
MTHRDIITITAFKEMGFKNINLKYLSDIKLNRITCELDVKVGKGTYTIPFEAFCNTSNKIILAKHYLFAEVKKMLEEFNALDYKSKVSYLEKLGAKD